jgi:hypothetical protein
MNEPTIAPEAVIIHFMGVPVEDHNELDHGATEESGEGTDPGF